MPCFLREREVGKEEPGIMPGFFFALRLAFLAVVFQNAQEVLYECRVEACTCT